MSPNKPSLVQFVMLLFLTLNCDKFITTCNKTEDVWRTAGRLTGLLLLNCMQLGSDGPQEQVLLILQQCLKHRSLVALDRSLKGDVIRLVNGIELVRYRKENDTDLDRYPAVFDRNFKSNEKEIDWKSQILQRVAHVLNTHTLKIRLNDHEESSSLNSQERGFRKKHNMMLSLLMFGVAAVGLIMVPLGFQFLAVLGGKALLLAKMALILTAIQGLKKIATSNLNYGLYATPEHHHGPCKDELCNVDYNPLEADDSVFLAIDVDELPQSHMNSYNVDSWHYDRQWPYDESHDVGASYNNYYQAPDQQTDLLHPFHPRLDSLKNTNL